MEQISIMGMALTGQIRALLTTKKGLAQTETHAVRSMLCLLCEILEHRKIDFQNFQQEEMCRLLLAFTNNDQGIDILFANMVPFVVNIYLLQQCNANVSIQHALSLISQIYWYRMFI